MTPILSIRAADKKFGQTIALSGASLELRRGELLALLGPNGAGKTTLIRAISGRVRLDRGEIVSNDGAVRAVSDQLASLGVVPQELAIYPLLTARENLRAFGAFHGLEGVTLAQRVEWALNWAGLADRAREPVGRFSGGMKRRLNIACGVLHQPRVILLDEPTVGVDPQSRERIWEMCKQLQRDGSSILLTTHQLDEAQQICDRIVIIDHGQVIASGTLAELVARTIGSQRRVTLTLAAPTGEDATRATREGEASRGGGAASGGDGLPGELSADGRRLTARVQDVAGELPALLTRVREHGLIVEDVHLEAPTLQAVFIHLTGRELRE
ncbi:MAG: ABC transporter ATP-binding protein [Phycisphaerae bacterium]